MPKLLTVQHIAKSFHLRPVLKDISFSLESGEISLLFGRNGTGKTTLLKILAGIMRPEKGSGVIEGRSIFKTDPDWRQYIIYLGHQANLYPVFTARENLRLSQRLRGQSWDEHRFQSHLDRYGLSGREDEPIGNFSAGMLQRLGLIRLELADWSLALLDEPTGALDLDGQSLLQDTLSAWEDKGRTVLLASHDVQWVTPLVHRALLVRDGVLAEDISDPVSSQIIPHLGGAA